MMAGPLLHKETPTPTEKIIAVLSKAITEANIQMLQGIFTDITEQAITGDHTIAPAVKN